MSEDALFCPACGEQIQPGAQFCRSCGRALKVAAVSAFDQNLPDPPLREVLWKLLAGGLIMNILIPIILGIIYYLVLFVLRINIASLPTLIGFILSVVLITLATVPVVMLVERLLFRDAVPLNKKRWERFSLTEFWSFALSALVGLIVYMQSGWNTPLAMVALFLVATLVGFGIGLFNVVRNQRKDREEVHKPPVPAKKPA